MNVRIGSFLIEVGSTRLHSMSNPPWLPVFRVFCCVLLGASLPAPAAAQEAGMQTRTQLVLGRVSDDPRRDAERLQPMLDYVIPRMRSVGIREGRILMARDAIAMQSYLRRRRVDWVSDSAAMGIDYRRRAGATLLLATERGGALGYRTVFLTWKGSGINRLDDLRGRSIAFQNAYSTSSYVTPAAELLRAGMKLDILLSPLDHAAPGRAGYLFARSEGNVVAWVRKRLVDAGAFSDLDWQRERPETLDIDDLFVFHQTPEMPRAVEVVAPMLAPAVRARLREVLLAAGDDPDAREALERFFATRRFVPIDAAFEAGLMRVQADLDLVREHLE